MMARHRKRPGEDPDYTVLPDVLPLDDVVYSHETVDPELARELSSESAPPSPM
ncbi:hypothetical protein GCM10027408_33020 [Microbacterium tumbae]